MSYEERIIRELNCEELSVLSAKERMGSKSKTKRIKEAIKEQMRIKMCYPSLSGF